MPKPFRPSPIIIQAINTYSANFYTDTLPANPNSNNYVASPFGAWILLAVLAASTDFSDVPEKEEEVTSILGLTPSAAGIAANDILDNLSGAELGIGVWFDANYALKAPRIVSWLDRNTSGTTASFIPPQAEMDAWTSEVTHGLIDKFPVVITPELMFLVASVVYTRFEWRDEYDVVDSKVSPVMLPWDTKTLLFGKNANVNFYLSEPSLLSLSKQGVIYAVHGRYSHAGQNVVSVMALNADVDEETLLRIAHSINKLDSGLKRLSYTDVALLLPNAVNAKPDEATLSLKWDKKIMNNNSRCDIYLPAWEADNTHDLDLPEFGFTAESDTLIIGYPYEHDGFTAKQTVVAKYGAKGFEAAAVTAFGMMRAANMIQETGGYVATLAFDKPFVSVCFVSGIPLFSAVVRIASEA